MGKLGIRPQGIDGCHRGQYLQVAQIVTRYTSVSGSKVGWVPSGVLSGVPASGAAREISEQLGLLGMWS